MLHSDVHLDVVDRVDQQLLDEPGPAWSSSLQPSVGAAEATPADVVSIVVPAISEPSNGDLNVALAADSLWHAVSPEVSDRTRAPFAAQLRIGATDMAQVASDAQRIMGQVSTASSYSTNSC